MTISAVCAGGQTLHPRYRLIRMYAAVNVLIWPIGVPLALLMMLHSQRRRIEGRRTRRGPPNLKALAPFFRLYDKRAWWLSIVELVRRLSLSCLLALFDPAHQLLVALWISMW